MDAEFDEYHVTIDFQSEKPDLSLPYSLMGLETDQPILRIDREIYKGTWTVTVGTEMIFDERGEWLMNVEKRLLMEKVEVVKKGEETNRRAKDTLVRAEDLQSRKLETVQYQEVAASQNPEEATDPMLVD